MPPLNKREQTLLIVFGVLAILVIIGIGVHFLLQWHRSMKLEEARLTNELTTAGFWISRGAELDAKSAWLAQNLSAFPGRNEAVDAALARIVSTTQAAGITLSAQEILDPETNSNDVRIRLRTATPIANLVRWLHALQSPENLSAVTQIEIKPIADSDNIDCTLIVTRFYPLPLN